MRFIFFLLFTAQAAFGDCRENLVIGAPRYPQDIVILTDAYSSVEEFPDEIRMIANRLGRSVQIINIHSQGEPIPNFRGSWRPEVFDHVISHRGNIDQTLDEIQSQLVGGRIVAVWPGTDGGVPLADLLARRLQAFNPFPFQTPIPQYDKFNTNRLIEEAGLPAVPQLLSNDLDEISEWISNGRFLNNGGAIVVKPIASGGAEDVTIASSLDEALAAARKLIGSRDEYDHLNAKALIAKFLKGPEHAINTVQTYDPHTYKMRPILSGVWEYFKRFTPAGNPIYWYDRFVLDPQSDRKLMATIRYDFQALEKLKMRFGWAHGEVKTTPEGPRLVEMNRRAIGSHIPTFEEILLPGRGQLTLGALAILDPEKLSKIPTYYKGKWEGIVFTLKTNAPGYYISAHADAVLRAIHGYVGHSFYQPRDQPLKPTDSLITGLGHVWIKAKKGDERTIQEAIKRVGEIEDQGLLETKIQPSRP